MSGFYGNAIIALLEISTLRALKPVVPGDTIRVQAEVLEIKHGDNPKYGELLVNYSVLNQKAEEVMVFKQRMLARRRLAGHS
jgi:acyl dehydratase